MSGSSRHQETKHIKNPGAKKPVRTYPPITPGGDWSKAVPAKRKSSIIR